MADIIHRIGIKAPLSKVYNALSTVEGVAGWWTKETAGTSKVGGKIEFRFRTPEGELIGGMDAKVAKLDKNKQVRWDITSGPSDWIGTNITFRLKQEGRTVIVLFGHNNWAAATESTAHCSMKWATFLLSLRELVEKGKGKPSPRDLKIDNWN